ncbi:MAG TPA: hypothetical protein PLN33_15730 [Hyphomonadaceae bacterium]|nr:hypothetical protein [Hyphomonadaceae bacterium]
MIRTLLLAVVALVAAACSGPQPADDSAPFVGFRGKPLKLASGAVDNAVQEALNANPDACTKAGGNVQPVCMMQRPMCVISFRDAGKTCSDSSECGGRCEVDGQAEPQKAATGKCTATNDPCGCFQIVEKGVAGYPLCAD